MLNDLEIQTSIDWNIMFKQTWVKLMPLLIPGALTLLLVEAFIALMINLPLSSQSKSLRCALCPVGGYQSFLLSTAWLCFPCLWDSSCFPSPRGAIPGSRNPWQSPNTSLVFDGLSQLQTGRSHCWKTRPVLIGNNVFQRFKELFIPKSPPPHSSGL